jgi:hypothetical protein
MILVRLFQWAFRIKCLPVVDETGYVEGQKRPPTFGEAVTGISGT